jgi:ribosomal protein S24E
MSNSSGLVQDNRNPLTKRREVVLKIPVSKNEATPSRAKTKQYIASLLNVDKELIVIKSIYHPFGSREVTVVVNIYDTPEKIRLFERKYLIERDIGNKKKEVTKQQADEAPAQTDKKGDPK